MTEIKGGAGTYLGCPCGGRVRMHTGFSRGNYAFAKCANCGKQTALWGNRHRAAEAWTSGKFVDSDYQEKLG